MPLERSAVAAALTLKGFKPVEGDHAFFIYYSRVGKKSPIRTKTSHGSGHKQITDNLVSQMAKQCKLTTKEFKGLVECSLGRHEYEMKLIEGGFVDPPPPR